MNTRRSGSLSLVRLLGNWQQPASRAPLYQQLAQALRLLILDGRLPLNSRLPGERELAAALNVSRTTVASALGQLRDEEYLVSRHGSGSVIVLPEQRSVPGRHSVPQALDLSTAALPAGPEIHHAFSHALSQLPGFLDHTGYDRQGLLSVRQTVAERYCARGLPTTADEIMMVNGAVQGFALVLRLLTGPGDRVAVDNPTYPLAHAAIEGASCRAVGIALPEQGWDCAALAATLAQTAPRLVYLLSDFHNPTGRCMDADTRREVAEIAARARTTLVVDETMVDLWYDAPPPPPLAAFGDRQTITIGSAGKSFWGGLRLGWVRAPARTIASLTQVRDSLDLGSPLLEQLAVQALINDGERFLPQRRAMLRERRDAAAAMLQRHFPEWRFQMPEGGLSFWIELPRPLASQFAASALSAGIHIGAGPRFGADGAFERFMRLPFALETARLEDALVRLQPIWQSLSRAPLRSRSLV